MPTIYKPPKKVYKREKTDSKKSNLNNKAVYNTTTWRLLRIEKLKKNPLCEVCFEKGIINMAREVHHKVPLSTGSTMQEKQVLGFDMNNLKSLCEQCHKDQHLKTTF